MSKLQSKKRKSRPEFSSGDKSLWGSSQGWKSFDVTDELLMGAEEGGFAGLEVLDDISLIDPAYMETLNEAAKQQQEAETAARGKQKATKKVQQQQPPAAASGSKRSRAATAAQQAPAGGDDADVETLKARIQQLEAENKALKKPRTDPTSLAAEPMDNPQTAGAASEETEAKVHRKKLKLKQFKQKKKERKQKLKEKRLKEQQEQSGAKNSKHQAKQQQPQGRTTTAAPAAGGGCDLDMSAWSRFCLHPKLEAALAAQGFSNPTPIQDAVLLPAIRDRRDVIGAAQTGSGKTLAFGLPILQVLLQEQELQQSQQQQQAATTAAYTADDGADAAAAAAAGSSLLSGSRSGKQGGPLRALILCPTRELALQVSDHLQALGKVAGIRVPALVGGIAPVKQERLLRSCPPVVVATPGRLWDLMRQGHKHLTNLEQLSFFVLDEADRMVQQGHYQELTHILELLPTAERAAAVAAAQAAEQEAQLQLEQAQQTRQKISKKQAQEQVHSDDDEDEDEQELHNEDDVSDSDIVQDGEDDNEPVAEDDDENHAEQQQDDAAVIQQQQQRGGQQQGSRNHLLQTFVFSATLTLPAHLHKRLRKGGGGSSGAASLESLMDRLHFRDRPAIIDLSPSTKLADRVTEGLLQVLDEERDATLYYVLARHPGRALVFVNAVSAVRRVTALLQLLGLPAVALHAQQQQRQRLKALDRFKGHPHGVLVATDVAARGLDISDVQIVLHYQLPASADTYIHRSGRTARTGGSDGVVLAMVTPQDASRWSALRRALEGQDQPPTFPIDDKILLMAKQRVTLAAKIDAIQRKDRKQHAASTWARSNAEALGVDLSDADDSDDEGLADLQHTAVKAAAAATTGKRKKCKNFAVAAESQTAAERLQAAGQLAGALGALQQQLAAALAVPLQPSISHKFFTGGMSRAAAAAAAVAANAAADQQAATGVPDQEVPVGEGAGSAAVNKPITVLPADAMAATVQLAARLNQSRLGDVAAAGGTGGLNKGGRQKAKTAAVVTERDASKARRRAAAAMLSAAGVKGSIVKLNGKGKGKVGKGKQASGATMQQAVLTRMLMSRNEIKRQKRQGGMVVVRPGAGAFGRDAAAASALDVLHTKR